MCGFNMKNSKKNTEVSEYSLSLSLKSRLRWFGHGEHKDDADWLKHCMKIETEGTWLEDMVGFCQKLDMDSFGLFNEDA